MNKLNKLLSAERRELEEECHRHRVSRKCCPAECDFCDIGERLRDLIDIREEYRWHAYPKEKPVNGKRYLVTRVWDAVGYIDTDVFREDGFDRDVTAWRELPEPYRKERI